jgi:FkbM family methyltransferase
MPDFNYEILNGKDIHEVIKIADDLSKKDIEGKLIAHEIYSSLLEVDQIPNIYDHPYANVRGSLRQKIFQIEKNFKWNIFYLSKAGQDKFIHNKFFKNKKDGFFIEIGAYDGTSGSNCFFFEKYLGWNGIAIEPSPNQFEILKKNRNCTCLNNAISNKNKKIEFVNVIEGYTEMSGINNKGYQRNLEILENHHLSKIEKININCITFPEAINENTIIDYLSIDVEGGEYDILESIDFEKYNIKIISIENNEPDKINFLNFLKEKNYDYIDNFGSDEIYAKRDF